MRLGRGSRWGRQRGRGIIQAVRVVKEVILVARFELCVAEKALVLLGRVD